MDIKQIMKNIVIVIVYMTENNHLNVLDKTGLVQDNLCESKDAYDGGEVTCRLFSAPKVQSCLTIDEYGNIDDNKTLKGFTDTEKTLHWSKNFVMIKSNKALLIYR